MIAFSILDLFMFISTIVAALVDGSFAAAFAKAEPDILVAVQIGAGVMIGLLAVLVLADAFIGFKALGVSKNPNADKGYITAAKVFFVLSGVAVISNAVSLFSGADVVDTILNLLSATLGAVVYALLIQAAQAVRADVINAK